MERPAFVRIPSTSRWASRIAWAGGFCPVEIADGGKLGHGPVRHVPGARLLENGPMQSADIRATPVVLLAVRGAREDARARHGRIDHRLGNPAHDFFGRRPLDELPRNVLLLGARGNLEP